MLYTLLRGEKIWKGQKQKKFKEIKNNNLVIAREWNVSQNASMDENSHASTIWQNLGGGRETSYDCFIKNWEFHFGFSIPLGPFIYLFVSVAIVCIFFMVSSFFIFFLRFFLSLRFFCLDWVARFFFRFFFHPHFFNFFDAHNSNTYSETHTRAAAASWTPTPSCICSKSPFQIKVFFSFVFYYLLLFRFIVWFFFHHLN